MKSKRIVDAELLATVRELPCMACFRGPSEAHHITTRGAGGNDVAENVIPLCHEHHMEWHLGILKFLTKFPSVVTWLKLARREDILARVGYPSSPEASLG